MDGERRRDNGAGGEGLTSRDSPADAERADSPADAERADSPADAERADSPAQPGRGRVRQPVPELADDPILEHLDAPPPPAPKPSKSSHVRLRRELITKPGQWAVLRTTVQLNQAAARRLVRSYARAKPARLEPAATGIFQARHFQRGTTWHVAVSYQLATPDSSR